MSIDLETLDDVYEELKKDNVSIEDKYPYVHKRTKGKVVNLSLGRIWFNMLLPEKYIKFVNEPVNKSKLNQIINDIYEDDNMTAEECAIFMTNLNKHSFIMSSLNPQTFDVDATIVPTKIKDKKVETLNEKTKIEDYGDNLKNLSEEYVKEYLKDTGIGNIINSGAKGSATDFGILTLSKGPTVDIENNIHPPIISALTDGYTAKEYYAASAEARNSLYVRGVGTVHPGTLARNVTYANSNTKIAEDDCKTKKYLELFVKPSMVTLLIGRWYINPKTEEEELITKKSKISNKIIKLRSPLYCKSKSGICRKCYGQLSNKLNTKQIGLVAGAAINAAGVEGYAMAVRHKSSQVKLNPVNFLTDIIQ